MSIDINSILETIGEYTQTFLEYVGINVSQSTGGIIGILVIIIVIALLLGKK